MHRVQRVPATEQQGRVHTSAITVAVLPHNADGQAVRGLNHFGFKVDSNAEIGERITRAGLRAPRKRPADRPYAEQRALDPEGNMFDISQHGFQRVETEAERSGEPAKVPVGAATK